MYSRLRMTSKVSVTGDGLQASRRLLAEVLDMEAADIADDAAIGGLAGWDSLGHMRLIMEIEAKMGKLLSPGNVVAIGSLQDIATVLEGGELSVSGF
jgi:acyl carrier protein